MKRSRLHRTYKGSNQYQTIERYYGLKLSTWKSIAVIVGVMTILTTIAMQAKAEVKAEGIVSPLPHFAAGLDENGLPVLSIEQTATWHDFIRAAHRVAPIYDYPVKVIIAQAALESGRGTSQFANDRYNYFGIGAYDSDPEQAFRYDNVDQGIIEYCRLIKHRYPEAYEARNNPERMIELIKQGGYASDPDYVAKLKRLPEWRGEL